VNIGAEVGVGGGGKSGLTTHSDFASRAESDETAVKPLRYCSHI